LGDNSDEISLERRKEESGGGNVLGVCTRGEGAGNKKGWNQSPINLTCVRAKVCEHLVSFKAIGLGETKREVLEKSTEKLGTHPEKRWGGKGQGGNEVAEQ